MKNKTKINSPKSGIELDGSSEWPLIFGGGGGGGLIDWFELDETTGARKTTFTCSLFGFGSKLFVVAVLLFVDGNFLIGRIDGR